jgi:SMI1-KNR4 cell-wall
LAIVWPADRILDDNSSFRADAEFAKLYMPFDDLLFFADAGNGDQFAFPITAAGARADVFVWNHEDDSRRWYASSLEQYLTWWLSGEHPI